MKEFDSTATEDLEFCQHDSGKHKEEKKADSRWSSFRPSVEPLVVLFMFSYISTTSVVPGLVMERVCGTSDTSQCTDDQVAYSTVLLMYKAIIEAIVPAVAALFLNTWSDKYGRRPLFIWSFVGNTIAFGLFCGLSTIPNLQPEWLLLPSVASTFSGGMLNLMAIANVYIADVSPDGQKEIRLGVLDASQYIALMIGSGVSAPIFTATSYAGIFGIAAGCMVIAFLYSIFLLKESKPILKRDKSESFGCCGGVFRPQLLKEALHTSLKKRPHNARPAIFMVVFAVVTAVLITQGEGIAGYQYTSTKFNWTVQDNQWLGFYNNGMAAVGTLLGVLVLVRLFHFSESIIVLITFSFKIAGAILFAFAPYWWYLYIGGALAGVGGMVWVLARTMLTRLVEKDEIGKVFGLAVTFEAMVPLVASPVYTGVFNASISSFPGAFYLLSAGIMVLDAGLMLTAALITRGAKKEANEKQNAKDIDLETQVTSR